MYNNIVIKYLPKETTKKDIQNIRKNFKDDAILILMISGEDKILDNIQALIDID